MGSAAVLTHRSTTAGSSLEDIEKKCRELGDMEVTATQRIGAKLLDISEKYYQDVRSQAVNSFIAALCVASFGIALFFVAIWLFMEGKTDKATIVVIASAMPQVISGVVFYLYFKTMRQFGYFHVCLERMNRFLTANSICANITSEVKRDDARAELVDTMAHASMLPIEGITANEPNLPKTKRPAERKTLAR